MTPLLFMVHSITNSIFSHSENKSEQQVVHFLRFLPLSMHWVDRYYQLSRIFQICFIISSVRTLSASQYILNTAISLLAPVALLYPAFAGSRQTTYFGNSLIQFVVFQYHKHHRVILAQQASILVAREQYLTILFNYTIYSVE